MRDNHATHTGRTAGRPLSVPEAGTGTDPAGSAEAGLHLSETVITLPDDYEGRVIATLVSAEIAPDAPLNAPPVPGTRPDGPVEVFPGDKAGASEAAARGMDDCSDDRRTAGPADADHAGASPARSGTGQAVLYIHGYIDYFFQYHMAAAFNAAGYNFYALDLRKYGRSILPGQTPYYCRDLHEYYPEIDRAIELVIGRGNSRIALLGHSTGGLIASLYMNDGTYRASIGRLVLNSPFLEYNTGWFKRRVAIPVSAVVGRVFPYAHKRNELSPHYTASVHASMRGEWNFDLRLKPLDGVPLYFAWLGAVRRGHLRVKRGLGITVPILLMHSSCSTTSRRWDESYTRCDGVLDVRDISRYGRRLGSDVTDIAVAGGLHDLVLSRREVRDEVLRLMIAWLGAEPPGPTGR